jgi:predicted negative regulator of RcsB-dependent stress response
MASVALALQLVVTGCSSSPRETARQLFEQTVRQYHLPSAGASGAEREKLLAQAASGYEQVVKLGKNEPQLCAAALRSLANVRAEQGRVDEAVTLYSHIGQQYSNCDWEVVQSWKSAADVLWDAGRQTEATSFYRKIAQRFASDPSPIIQTVARAASRRAGAG